MLAEMDEVFSSVELCGLSEHTCMHSGWTG